jgi:glycosyltransferase involved in cell wall biosynthesis
MRVGIDGRSLVQLRGRGIARYTETLLNALAAAFPGDDWRVLVPSGGRAPAIAGVELVRAPVRGRALYGAAALTGRPRFDELLGGVDLFWAPAPGPLALSAHTPLVLTVHDLAWEVRPGDFTRYERMWHRLVRPRTLAERAARVIAVSDATRRAAIDLWTLDPARVVTLHEPVPAPPCSPSGTDAAYLLSVGALEPRKGLDVLVAAFERARAAGLTAELWIVGEGRWHDRLTGPGIRRLGYVSDADLHRLYAGALALVMPSRHEGFGRPPLEAAQHGTPSILTDLPVFRETLDQAAQFVPVDDPEALAAAMVTLTGDAALRARVGAAAQARTAEFMPERAARELHQVLSAVAVMFKRT